MAKHQMRKRGRPEGPTNKTMALVEKVYQYRDNGWSVQRIADKFGVTRGYIYHLLNTYELAD